MRQTINLQFFAQEKTEKATPKRRLESRKKGQVAKSTEVPTAFILFFVFILLFFIGGWLGDKILMLFKITFHDFIHEEIDIVSVTKIFQVMFIEGAVIMAPIMAMAVFAGFFSNYIQVGVLFTAYPLKPKLEKISMIKGFKRIFSLRTIVEFLKSIFKILVISTVSFTIIWIYKEDLFQTSQTSIPDILRLISSLVFQIGITVAIILLFMSILDYLYQKYDFEKNNRMSKQDVKDEHKKTEGDPLIKGKIRQKQRQMAVSRMMQEIPNADVIITNPTHYAIAVKYDADAMLAPEVIAKGTDYVALKIREIAEEHKVPIVENKPLARALHGQVDIGDAVPEELYQAVAEILAYVYRLNRKYKS